MVFVCTFFNWPVRAGINFSALFLLKRVFSFYKWKDSCNGNPSFFVQITIITQRILALYRYITLNQTNTMKYYKLDTLRICVTTTRILMYMPGKPPKSAFIVDNPEQLKMVESFEKITEKEFEDNLPSTTASDCLFKALYINAKEEGL